MELSSSVFSEVLTPLAAFVDLVDKESDLPEEIGEENHNAVLSSSPHDQLDCLPPCQQQTWRLDGIDIDGTRFFAVPRFAINAPPVRIDVYIPPVEEHPRTLRHLLKSDATMYTTDKESAASLHISRYLLSALDHWSSTTLDFEEQYSSMPFGSRILVTDLTPNPAHAAIHLVPNYAVEQAMISLECLQQMWPSHLDWPETIDTSELLFQSQPHEAITLIQIPQTQSSSTFVFKSLVRDQKYLYNELKMLLSLPPHPNLVSKPLYIVTHKCRFGGKRGVAGFVLEYYPLGSLSGYLASTPDIPLSSRLRWAKQITQALMHVNTSLPCGFYPDLKPDNIVLRDNPKTGEVDAVLLDLEQRGGWFSWSPPEVVYVEYMEIIASRAPDEKAREEAWRLLNQYIPGWTASGQDERYKNVEGGFSAPWLALMEKRSGGPLHTLLEKAQVFMLGKLLWCIFEGRSVVRCGIDHEILRDPDPNFGDEGSFPTFDQTPLAVRDLIKTCTLGAPEYNHFSRGRGLVLRKGKLVPAGWSGEGEMPTARETQEEIKWWWEQEIRAAKKFLRDITAPRVTEGREEVASPLLKATLSRPLLEQVWRQLERVDEIV
jgi:hypothetical protein